MEDSMKRLIFTLLMINLSIASAIESPKYSVLLEEDNFQIREYESYFVASTTYDISKGESRRDAFMTLFGYISGENKVKTKISMTAPVTDSVKIAMTAPVTDVKKGTKRIMTFMVPSQFYKTGIPQPTNPKVTIEEVPAQIIASHTFSWFAGEEKRERKSKELKKWLEERGNYTIISDPIYAGYNAPYTLPPLKRHEMLFIIEKK